MNLNSDERHGVKPAAPHGAADGHTVQRTGAARVGVVGGAALRGAVDGQLRETADAAAGKLQRADAAAGGVR